MAEDEMKARAPIEVTPEMIAAVERVLSAYDPDGTRISYRVEAVEVIRAFVGASDDLKKLVRLSDTGL